MKLSGTAYMDIEEATAGDRCIFTIIYETGPYGIDDGGEILIARRDVCDSAIPQFDDPSGEGYVSIASDTGATLISSYITTRYIRPWKACISIKVKDGSLSPGEKVYVRFGDSSGGGYRFQTFPEERHIFKILEDCAGSGNFYEIAKSPEICIKGGPVARLEVCSPSYAVPGEDFKVLARALDRFGNISTDATDTVEVSIGPVFKKAALIDGTVYIEGFSLDKPGIYRPSIKIPEKQAPGTGNPVMCVDNPPSLYWGDMHGQTGETVGTGTPELYFSFARDKAGLDFSGWQGNDFQITDGLWDKMDRIVRKFNKPGEFVCFPGYEWSGTTPAGGDHNIYFLNDGCPIHRSYRWQIGMGKEDGSSRNPISELWKEFEGRNDVMAIPHVGGRYANFDYFNPEIIPVVEIHSHHGSFEWFFRDALGRGLKPGIIAASDDHSCRPGLSFPTKITSRGGFVSFDVKGGYTGVLADRLDRESIWKAIKARHCYGTSGERIIMDVRCADHIMGDEFHLDSPPVLEISAAGTSPIRNLYVMRNLETVFSLNENRPMDKSLIYIEWSGVRVKSRAKKALWDGTVKVRHGTITGFKQYESIKSTGSAELLSGNFLKFASSTSGDTDGIVLSMIKTPETVLEVDTNHGSMIFKTSELDSGEIALTAGGVNLEIRAGHPPSSMHDFLDLRFIDTNIAKGLNAYWVKLVQDDGHKAWTSPMYIRYDG